MADNSTKNLIIEADKVDLHYWADLWHYRELLKQLAWRDIQVRYKQAILGVTWALIQPAVQVILLTFVFSKLASMPAGNIPYPVLVLAGLLPWQLFSSVFSNAGNCLVGNSNLVSKVYFPRMIMPLSSAAAGLVDMLILLGLALPFMYVAGMNPGWQLLLLPLFIIGTLLVALGAGLWISALTVKYRDFRFVAPFILQIGVFVTPVGYRADLLPEWGWLLSFNPLSAMVAGHRWCLTGGMTPFDAYTLIPAGAVTLMLLCGGIWYFRHTERQFADMI